MYKQCQTEQSAARQRQLEQGLLKMMLRQRFEQISISELCDEMKIPRKAFYRYFSGKEGALYSLIDHAIMDFDTFSTIDATREHQQSAQKYMERVFSYWVKNKPLLDALERSNLSGVLIQRAIAYSKDVNSLPRFLQTANQQQQDYATLFAVCGMMTLIVQWHHDGFTQSVEQMARLTIRLLSQPLVAAE